MQPVSDGPVNPKNKYGAAKPAVSAIPPVAVLVMGQAFSEGERKYGHFNWRQNPVPLRTYYDACQRHLMAFMDGQDNDPDTGINHLGMAMASLGIILDSMHQGTLADNRNSMKGTSPEWIKANTKPLTEPITASFDQALHRRLVETLGTPFADRKFVLDVNDRIGEPCGVCGKYPCDAHGHHYVPASQT